MMEWQFKGNGQFAVVTDLTIVSGFKALSYAQQEGQEGEEFRKANFSACFTIMKYVSTPIRTKLSTYKLAYDMWIYLSNTYDPKLSSMKNEARIKINDLKFAMHGNMSGFVKRFNELLDDYRHQRGIVSEEEELEMFKATLPSFFNSIKDWFDSLSLENQNILTLQNKCINRHTEYQSERVEKKKYYNNSNNSNGSRGNNNQTGNRVRASNHHQYPSSSDSQKVIKCHNCGGLAYDAS